VLLGVGNVKSYIAKVETVLGDKVRVHLGQNSMIVWGTASVGDTVMISNAQVIAVINEEHLQIVHVP